MFNNVAVDVFIGLIFVFLIYSLLATIINELIAHILSLRGKMLYKGIRRMLEDSTEGRILVEKFYNHPNIKYLAENKVFKKPSYLKTETFSQTVIYLLRGDNFNNTQSQMAAIKATLDTYGNEIPPDTLKLLNNIYVDAQGDIDRFKYRLEQWFEETMQRTSGWYKRQTQWILLGIGLGLAIWGNIDTLKLYHILSTNQTAREQMVQMAMKSQDKYAAAINTIKKDTTDKKADSALISKVISTGNSDLDKTYSVVQSDIDKAGSVLGMGYHNSKNYHKCDSLQKAIDSIDNILKTAKGDSVIKALQNERISSQKLYDETSKEVYDDFDGGSSILGWILTALALSLGAPFWFDLLNKFINIRAAGTKPADTTTASTGTKGPTPIDRKG
jgi:hypothetical protein